MQIHSVLTRQDRLAFQLHHVQKSGLRWQGYLFSLLSTGITLWFCFCGFRWPDLSRGVFSVDVFVLLLTPVIHYFYRDYELARKLRKAVWERAEARRLAGDDDGDGVITLTPAALREFITKDQFTKQHRWAEIEGVYETSRHLFIYLNADAGMTIPKRSFATPAACADFLQLARSYWQQANPEKTLPTRRLRIPLSMRMAALPLAPPSIIFFVVLFALGPLFRVLLHTSAGASFNKLLPEAVLAEFEASRYPELHLRAARLEAEEAWQGVAAVYQQLVQLEPQNPRGHLGLGRACKELEKYDLSETHYRAALRLQPDSIEALYGLGYAAYRQNQHAAAETWFRQCLALAPQHAGANYLLGHTYQEQGKNELAVLRYRAVLQQAPFSARARSAQKRLTEIRRQRWVGWFAFGAQPFQRE